MSDAIAYPIYLLGEPILRQECEPVSIIVPMELYIEKTIAAIKATDTGVGMAAPQVGLPYTFFIMSDPSQTRFEVFINPKIIATKGADRRNREGCLSIPGAYALVRRPSKVQVKYWDRDIVEHTKWFKGLSAVIIQHEMDHFKGILFYDRLTPAEFEPIKGMVRSLLEGKTPTVEYEVSHNTPTAKKL